MGRPKSPVELARVFAVHTTLAWNSLQRERQFQTALGSRDLIGQAKGILMEEHGVNETEAYRRIQVQSMNLRKSMKEVAEAIILARSV